MLTRVAVVQFQVKAEAPLNLATCLRLIDQAAQFQPTVIVLPEASNYGGRYKNQAQCYAAALPLDGEFLTAIAAQARTYHCYLVINSTLQRESGKVTVTSLLYDPTGDLLLQADRQVLLSHEREFLERATAEPAMATLPFGNLALYCGADGLRADIPRELAVRGAQVLCHSLANPDMPVAARAAENRVFVLAANIGASQIVAPDGVVLAQAASTGEAVLWADIDITLADNKKRPDGTDLFAQRRPGLYPPSAHRARATRYPASEATVAAAVYQPQTDGPEAINECAQAVTQAVNQGAQLIVLPELFCFEAGLVKDPFAATERSAQAIDMLRHTLADSGAVVVTSLVERGDNSYQHMGVIIGRKGVVARQAQLHLSQRHARWCAQLGQRLDVTPMPWGRLALIVGDDALYPETFRLAARYGAEVAAIAFRVSEKWEVELGLPQRAADNRVCLAAATRPTEVGTSILITRPAANAPAPLITHAESKPGLTYATLHPAHAHNNMLDSRPWPSLRSLINGT